ncbi:WhiB family transcriptional regulator [Streptomyces sp. NPDC048551]|uniref:WhiB family transcriptional regulator n=1 Tax=Streptomyces sp. NPDC048551 TaxID=3155758 RepID=UPI003443864C
MITHPYGPHRTPETPDPEPWTGKAVCATVDPDLMYPDRGNKPAYAQARQVCAVCPVIGQCLAEAMDLEGAAGKDHRHGVRGGLSPAERAELYARQRRTQQAAA